MKAPDVYRSHTAAEDEARRRAKKYRRPYRVIANPDRRDIDHGWKVVVDRETVRR